jgi:hypothetical protein
MDSTSLHQTGKMKAVNSILARFGKPKFLSLFVYIKLPKNAIEVYKKCSRIDLGFGEYGFSPGFSFSINDRRNFSTMNP